MQLEHRSITNISIPKISNKIPQCGHLVNRLAAHRCKTLSVHSSRVKYSSRAIFLSPENFHPLTFDESAERLVPLIGPNGNSPSISVRCKFGSWKAKEVSEVQGSGEALAVSRLSKEGGGGKRSYVVAG